MAAQTVAVSVGIMWTPPFATLNSGNSSFNLSAQYVAQNVGQVDVPGATASGTVVPIPFGSVSQCKVLFVKNMMSSDLGVRFNGAVANDFKVAPGACVAIFQPAAPTDEQIASVSVVTTAIPGSTENVMFWILGD